MAKLFRLGYDTTDGMESFALKKASNLMSFVLKRKLSLPLSELVF